MPHNRERFMDRAERFARDGIRGEAWVVHSRPGRWIWISFCALSSYFSIEATMWPWPSTWVTHGQGVALDVVSCLMALHMAVHAWLALSYRVCLLPCNAFHPNWTRPPVNRQNI
jgi:hypothetical protein